MAVLTAEAWSEQRAESAARWRRITNSIFFLGPATLFVLVFLVSPVILDFAIAFTNLGQNLRVTEVSLNNFERVFTGDPLLRQVIARTLLYVFGTLLVFNTTFGIVLALTTTALPDGPGSFFRSVWLLPRMSPSVVYIILWNWSVHSGDTSLINQVLINVFGADRPTNLFLSSPMMLVIMANGFVGASFAMVILTAATRSIPSHLFQAARVDGAGSFAILRHIVLPSLRWPITYVAIWQALSLLVGFEYILLLTGGGPFQDTTVLALYVYRRAFASGQYGYGAALAVLLIVPGILFALFMWRYSKMRNLMQQPRIEVH